MKIIKTADGSTTLYVEELDETYHSRHGAIQEAMHVFIDTGLNRCDKKNVRIFEMGFGTGLNAYLTLLNSKEKSIEYTGLEKYPVPQEVYKEVDYWKELHREEKDFLKLHESSWEDFNSINDNFKLRKIQGDLKSLDLKEKFDLIYYDAFGPRAQETLWSKEVLERVVNIMDKDSVFVTYCAKGQVRRDLQELGLEMERLPGPPGKREMLFGKLVS